MVEINPNNSIVSKMFLKDAFIYIGEQRKGMSLTKSMIADLYREYDALFEEHDLKELKYEISCDTHNNTIQFTPIRKIDKLAIRGLLSM